MAEIQNLNYAKAYSDTLAQAFPYVLNFGAIYATPNNGRYRFTGGKTIEIPVISTTGRTAASRDTMTDASRQYENSWETKTLTNQRKWSTLIHPADVDQTNYAATISNITSVFNNEHKFPEMDAYAVSKIYADVASNTGSVTELNLTKSNILATFDTLMQNMTESRVPATGRILYVTPAVMTILKSVDGITRSFDVKSGGEIDRTVKMLDGVEVVEVPASLMKTKYTFTNGWAAASDAKQIEMMLIHPECVIAPVSYQFAKLDAPSAVTGGKYVYYEESFEDVFVLDKRKAGVAFVIEKAQTQQSGT